MWFGLITTGLALSAAVAHHRRRGVTSAFEVLRSVFMLGPVVGLRVECGRTGSQADPVAARARGGTATRRAGFTESSFRREAGDAEMDTQGVAEREWLGHGPVGDCSGAIWRSAAPRVAPKRPAAAGGASPYRGRSVRT